MLAYICIESECIAKLILILVLSRIASQVKDLVKTLVQEKDDTIKVLSDFALGKGGHYGSD
jgi:hypothetical protein